MEKELGIQIELYIDFPDQELADEGDVPKLIVKIGDNDEEFSIARLITESIKLNAINDADRLDNADVMLSWIADLAQFTEKIKNKIKEKMRGNEYST